MRSRLRAATTGQRIALGLGLLLAATALLLTWTLDVTYQGVSCGAVGQPNKAEIDRDVNQTLRDATESANYYEESSADDVLDTAEDEAVDGCATARNSRGRLYAIMGGVGIAGAIGGWYLFRDDTGEADSAAAQDTSRSQ
ncbi:MAG: hypothetical protein J2P16_00270 [Mycobacterium sp.]|nr:hypothetical protein [Mycobacterium sp.]